MVSSPVSRPSGRLPARGPAVPSQLQGVDVQLALPALLDALPLGVVVHDEGGQLIRANQAFADLLGYEIADLRHMNTKDVICSEDVPKCNDLTLQMSTADITSATSEWRLKHRDGTTVATRVHKSSILLGDRRLFLACVQDTRDEELLMAELRYAAMHDQLTGVLNRAGIAQATARLQSDGRWGTVAVVDINRLKLVNDRYGHVAGDLMLLTAARRLSTTVTPPGIVGRLGGDEFLVVTVEPDSDLKADIAAALTGPVEVHPGTEVRLSASIGTAPFGPDSNMEQVWGLADREMYQHKQLSRSSLQTF